MNVPLESERDYLLTARDPGVESWEFPGWGDRVTLEAPNHDDIDLIATPGRTSHKTPSEAEILVDERKFLSRKRDSTHVKLGEWRSTAICGNDITASCFYAAGLCAAAAGTLAPVALILVAVVLYLFRSIYSEVVMALQMNGGVYTILLNSSSKRIASLASVLSILSYIATCVVCAASAMFYLHNIVPGLNVFWAAILVMAFFALVSLLGMGESANVSVAIFTFHLTTLLMLLVASVIKIISEPQQFIDNWTHMSLGYTETSPTVISALFFGYCAAMLGVTGFETSSNFVEEQKEGVFPKTLRNMWWCVAFFNPAISLCATGLMPVKEMAIDHQTDLLAYMGRLSAGPWLQTIVVVDATLVLCGSVLTSYVGVTGLIKRMSLDRCMPQVFLYQNRRGSNHWIIISFFLLCSALFAMADGSSEVLSNVYTIAFLSVMTLNAFGNLVLKYKRKRLPRPIRAGPLRVIIGMVMTFLAVVGTVIAQPENLVPFSIFYAVGALIVFSMLTRRQLLKLVHAAAKEIAKEPEGARARWTPKWCAQLGATIVSWLQNLLSDSNQTVIFFAKTSNLTVLNKALLYIRDNEITSNVKVVHVYSDDRDIPADLDQNIFFLDRCYAKIKVDLVLLKSSSHFGPDAVNFVSYTFGVPPNFMFVTCPSHRFKHKLNDMLGVRVITA